MVGTSSFAWLDSSIWDFQYWSTGEPSGMENGQLCSYVNKVDGKWLISSCSEEKTFICQIKL